MEDVAEASRVPHREADSSVLLPRTPIPCFEQDALLTNAV